MKKFFMTALIALALGTSAYAGPNTISAKVNEHFTTSFRNAKNVAWKAEQKFDKVSFVLDGIKIQAFYGTEGELIGTSKTHAFDKLPKSAIENITTRYMYPEYQLKDCIEFTNADKESSYYVSLAKQTETVVLEITKGGSVSVFARNKK